MTTNPLPGLFINYDRPKQRLLVSERTVSGDGKVSDCQLLEFSFAENHDVDMQVVEQTLGQLILYSLEKLTAGGLGFGDYSNLLDRISEENFEVFSHGLDLSNADDQYDLATLMFSRGRRIGSWEMVERAIDLFTKASTGGHREAKRFLEEDLPVVRSRLEEKLKRS